MKITPPKNLEREEHLLYRWILWCGNGNERSQEATGNGDAIILPNKPCHEKLDIAHLDYSKQYVFTMTFGRTKEELGKYKTQANFTVVNRELLYLYLALIAVGGIAGAITTLVVQALT